MLYKIDSKGNLTDEIYFRCKMNEVQFRALSQHLSVTNIEQQISYNEYFNNKISIASDYDRGLVEKWLKNSWNTESVLHQNLIIIRETGQSFCMQWVFPQAYYTVFGNILAMYKAIGLTEESHAAVIKKYGNMMVENKLPEAISLCCCGVKDEYNFYNIKEPNNKYSSPYLDIYNYDSIRHQICQFLKSTRKLRLEEKAPKINLKTKKGTKKKRLTREEWRKVSKSLGPTSAVDFLYRKRIKGNYKEIEIYNSEYFKGNVVLNSLQ